METRRSIGSPADGDAGAPVLRPETVRDVEPGHDLDPGDQGQPGVPGHFHHLAQHAVDAVADGDPALDRLDVDVAGPAGHPVREHHVHQPDDRTLAGLLGAGRPLVILVGQLLDLEVAPHALEQPGDHLVAPTVDLVQLVADHPRRGEQHPHLAPGGEGQRLLGVEVERVGGGDLEVGVGLPHRDDVVPAGQLLGHGLRGPGIDPGHVRHREAEPRGDQAEHLIVADQLPLHRRLPERARRGDLLADGRETVGGEHRLEGGDQPFVGELHAGGSLAGRKWGWSESVLI